ncbi:hypothetical protein CBM2588_A110050 [Cupriavidus taiwanensis]|nr:hypothetical protein CBM2588_A110050 [Cupriavidus taiwanensis]SOZ76986.1 hypothetical protein CBM2622_A140050 [Cupriavidus taiwanensis]SOZ83149.1 hypothetical protein CBM2621_A140050 [Cupriavidus taiwanensis]SPA44119.1 hypothetical protein CBM2629_A130012 [Cupriavidus taiwanensis]
MPFVPSVLLCARAVASPPVREPRVSRLSPAADYRHVVVRGGWHGRRHMPQRHNLGRNPLYNVRAP